MSKRCDIMRLLIELSFKMLYENSKRVIRKAIKRNRYYSSFIFCLMHTFILFGTEYENIKDKSLKHILIVELF